MQATKALIDELVFDLPDGKHFVVPVYLSGKKTCRIFVEYGKIMGFAGSRIKKEKALETIRNMVLKYSGLKDMTFESILDWNHDPKTVYFLGRKRILTNDVTKRDDSNYFYVRKNAKFQNAYDNRCMEYVKERLLVEIKKTGIDFETFRNGFSVKIGNYRSKIASVMIRRREFRFDRRLFAYTQPVIDSVVDHEITHLNNANHSKKFYADLYLMCPKERYNSCRKAINEGRFTYVPAESD